MDTNSAQNAVETIHQSGTISRLQSVIYRRSLDHRLILESPTAVMFCDICGKEEKAFHWYTCGLDDA